MKQAGPTEYQKKIAAKLGIDISRDTSRVAAARLRELIEPAINLNFRPLPATQKQIKYAKALDLDLTKEGLLVTSAKILDKLSEINRKALANMKLKSGDQVEKIERVEINGKFKEWTIKFTVSSIGRDGRVYFKGGNGACAWPCQIRKIHCKENASKKR